MMITRIQRVDCDYFSIMFDDVICGGVAVYKPSTENHWIAIIYIDPEYQNTKIAQTAISLLFEMYPNAKKWGLDFPIDRIANKKCYERLGYTDTQKREVINDKLTLAIYEKII